MSFACLMLHSCISSWRHRLLLENVGVWRPGSAQVSVLSQSAGASKPRLLLLPQSVQFQFWQKIRYAGLYFLAPELAHTGNQTVILSSFTHWDLGVQVVLQLLQSWDILNCLMGIGFCHHDAWACNKWCFYVEKIRNHWSKSVGIIDMYSSESPVYSVICKLFQGLQLHLFQISSFCSLLFLIYY